jgi:hypothetical protein
MRYTPNLTARRPGQITQPDGSTLHVLSLSTYRTRFALRFAHLAGARPSADVMRAAVKLRARGVEWPEAATELAGDYLAAKLPPEVG